MTPEPNRWRIRVQGTLLVSDSFITKPRAARLPLQSTPRNPPSKMLTMLLARSIKANKNVVTARPSSVPISMFGK